jgi:hypothetical protein
MLVLVESWLNRLSVAVDVDGITGRVTSTYISIAFWSLVVAELKVPAVSIVYGLSATEAGTTTALSEGPKQHEKAHTVSNTKKSGVRRSRS